MIRLLVALMTGTIVFAAVYAAATSVSLSSDDIAAGDAAVTRCDDAFTTVGFVTEPVGADDLITHVTIGQIAVPECQGGALTVTLLSNADAIVGKGSVEVSGAEAEVEITSGTPYTKDVKRVAVVVIGP